MRKLSSLPPNRRKFPYPSLPSASSSQRPHLTSLWSLAPLPRTFLPPSLLHSLVAACVVRPRTLLSSPVVSCHKTCTPLDAVNPPCPFLSPQQPGIGNRTTSKHRQALDCSGQLITTRLTVFASTIHPPTRPSVRPSFLEVGGPFPTPHATLSLGDHHVCLCPPPSWG